MVPIRGILSHIQGMTRQSAPIMAQAKRLSTQGGLSGIKYRIASVEHYPAILDLLYRSFFTDEPMSKSIGLVDGKTQDKSLDELCLGGLCQNLSLVALDEKTNLLLGVSINGVATKESYECSMVEILSGIDSVKFRPIAELLTTINKQNMHIYDDLHTNTLFDIKMITTNPDVRKGGLATDLILRSCSLATALGFKACKAEATGKFSKKAFERLGFTPVAELHYADFKKDGKVVFDNTGVHSCTTLVTKEIEA